jgi:hypothetical protein
VDITILFFETGCGMDDISNATHLLERAPVCQVLQICLIFINTPLTIMG